MMRSVSSPRRNTELSVISSTIRDGDTRVSINARLSASTKAW